MSANRAPMQRIRMLRLLALIEHPDALPAGAALRLGRELLSATGFGDGDVRCDAVDGSERAVSSPLDGGL